MWVNLHTERIFPAPNPFFNISNAEVELLEKAGGGVFPEIITEPPMNVQTDQELEVKFKWTQSGFLGGPPFTMPFDFMMGVYLERMGKGDDVEKEKKIDFEQGNPHTYEGVNKSITFAPGEIDPGTYKVVATLKIQIEGWSPDDKIVAAFEEIGTINVYKPAF